MQMHKRVNISGIVNRQPWHRLAMQRTVFSELGGNNMAFKSWVVATLNIKVLYCQHVLIMMSTCIEMTALLRNVTAIYRSTGTLVISPDISIFWDLRGTILCLWCMKWARLLDKNTEAIVLCTRGNHKSICQCFLTLDNREVKQVR